VVPCAAALFSRLLIAVHDTRSGVASLGVGAVGSFCQVFLHEPFRLGIQSKCLIVFRTLERPEERLLAAERARADPARIVEAEAIFAARQGRYERRVHYFEANAARVGFIIVVRSVTVGARGARRDDYSCGAGWLAHNGRGGDTRNKARRG
jgi:hypothetical protein